MSERDTIAMLCAWGEWSRTGGVQLRAKSQMLVVMQLVQPAGLHDDPDISDDAALRVDRAVARLKSRDIESAKIIDLYFVRGLSMREIESRMKLSKFNAAKLFSSACGWIDCMLTAVDQAA